MKSKLKKNIVAFLLFSFVIGINCTFNFRPTANNQFSFIELSYGTPAMAKKDTVKKDTIDPAPYLITHSVEKPIIVQLVEWVEDLFE